MECLMKNFNEIENMKIIKRDKSAQSFTPNKILNRIKTQAKGLKVDCDLLFKEVIPLITDNITTTEIDEIIAFKAADKVIRHPDYSVLGGRILLSRQSKLIGKELQPVDMTYDFFAATTFLSKYSIKDDNKTPIELPSCMYNRVANYLHDDNEDNRNELLEEITNKRGNFATPTYTNAGVPERNGMISCNLTHLEDDSFEGIENTLTKIAAASKEGSGIGLLIDPLRSKDSIVESFKGNAGGVVRLADMVQSKMRFYKQGSRSGSCALYLSVWHRDIFDFLELTLPIGDEQLRTRDLFTAVVINDLFMNKLQNNEDWYTFCPNEIKKAGLRPLHDLHGQEFENEYYKAVELGLGKKVNPKAIFDSIIKSQVESGKPYVMFKDNANKRNMQSNIGVIKQSNLCCLDGETLITITNQNGGIEKITMKDVVDRFNNDETLFVLSQDNTFRPILGAIKTKEDAEVIEVVDEEKGIKLICTPDHRIYTKNRGYVMACDLLEDDELDLNFN
jgi:ribonucleoside-diphosphate reductase alpha chain